LSPPGTLPVLNYRPNTTLDFGIGASYRSLTVNVGIGLNSFNPNEERGKTHYFDLQTHVYNRDWSVDLFGQFYRGYYLSPQGLGSADGQSYYVRSDLAVQYGGLAVYRVLNERKFSYQAGLVENERQKKSAGSFLIGGETYYGAIHGDSSIVPGTIDPVYKQMNITKVHFFEIGPGVGYAYTYVYKQHYFLLGSATINVDFRYTVENGITQNGGKIDIAPNYIFHAGGGYNTKNWSLSILWVSEQIQVKGTSSDYKYFITTGNYRLIYAKRFALNRKTKKVLNPINNLIEIPPIKHP
jgi:hypothetical protein